jgi:lysophospholipase L1-like esterase
MNFKKNVKQNYMKSIIVLFFSISVVVVISIQKIANQYFFNSTQKNINQIVDSKNDATVLLAGFSEGDIVSKLESLAEIYSLNNNSFIQAQLGKDIPISGNLENMKYFFNALKESKTRKVRIADYGDSGHEGDLISGDLREMLQNQFGGNGVGFLSITSQDITFRSSTTHSFSNNWKTVSVITGKDNKIPFGMNGFVSVPEQAGSWVMYEASEQFSKSSNFRYAKLYYSNAKDGLLKYSFDNEPEKSIKLSSAKGVQELILDPLKSAKKIKIITTMSNQAQFHGVSLEGGNGVYLDNFAWRGNTGISFRDIPTEIKNDYKNYFDYKLIIFTFGANMLSAGNVNFPWYEAQMTKVIEELKSAFPETSFLMVGLGDKSIKRGSNFVTHPSVKRMIETQKKIAQKTNIAFWNKFEAMGGENSMVEWVNSNPPLAAVDYGHLTYTGSKRISELIARALISGSNK